MKRQDLGVAGLWLVAVAIMAAAVIYGLVNTLDAVAKIAVGIIGAAAMLLSAVVAHALTALREQRLELQRQKQINYAALVDRLVPYVRHATAETDELTKIHLYSWVVGSPEVVRRTNTFMVERSKINLRALLNEMRQDVGLSTLDYDAPLTGILDPLPGPGSLR